MYESERLREQAERCMRLAETVLDPKASNALRALAAQYLERAQRLEEREIPPGTADFVPEQQPIVPEQQPMQQQQQIQPGDKKEE
jgi:hypothetical protein